MHALRPPHDSFFSWPNVMHWLPIVNIIFFYLALNWIQRLEKTNCVCSVDWRRTYMKWFYIASILFQVALLTNSRTLLKFLAVPISAASIGYLYVTLTYVHRLIASSCDCTSGQHRTILFWLALGQAFLLAFSIFVGAKKHK
jgi:hypothetical protein